MLMDKDTLCRSCLKNAWTASTRNCIHSRHPERNDMLKGLAEEVALLRFNNCYCWVPVIVGMLLAAVHRCQMWHVQSSFWLL